MSHSDQSRTRLPYADDEPTPEPRRRGAPQKAERALSSGDLPEWRGFGKKPAVQCRICEDWGQHLGDDGRYRVRCSCAAGRLITDEELATFNRHLEPKIIPAPRPNVVLRNSITPENIAARLAQEQRR